MRVLDFLAQSAASAGVSEIARELGINKSTCYNVLLTLQQFDVVHKSSVDAKYRLGPKLVELGAAVRRNVSRRSRLRQELRRLAEETGLGCVIAQVLGDSASYVVVDRISPRSPVETMAPPIGGVYPLTAPAIGRAALSQLDIEEAMDLVQRVTGTLPAEEDRGWRGRLAEIKAKGYATSEQEYERGTSAVASAIVRDGEIDAVICIVGRAADLPSSRLALLGERLAAIARRIQTTNEHGDESL